MYGREWEELLETYVGEKPECGERGKAYDSPKYKRGKRSGQNTMKSLRKSVDIGGRRN